MTQQTVAAKHTSPIKVLFVAAAIVVALWFAAEIIQVLFLFFLALTLTLILNVPTMWLVSKELSRTVAALLVFFLALGFLVLIGWLTIPKIIEQINVLIASLPQYINSLTSKLVSLFKDYPSIQDKLRPDTIFGDNLPSAVTQARHITRFSLALLSTIFVLILFFSIVAYLLINPAPLIQTYPEFFPKNKREKRPVPLPISPACLPVGCGRTLLWV